VVLFQAAKALCADLQRHLAAATVAAAATPQLAPSPAPTAAPEAEEDGVLRPALERLRQEHAALTAMHGDMQERADKCVKRLLAVHAAFEEVHATTQLLCMTYTPFTSLSRVAPWHLDVGPPCGRRRTPTAP